ncbi:MAG: hypothetical protein ABI835_22150 [Chloroflexota bacterium]
MSSYQIAIGHDNAAGLSELAQLDPPLFAAYTEGLVTEWHDCEARVWSGDRQLVPVGRAWVVWQFFRLTRDEMASLRENFGSALAQTSPVTIRTLDKGANAFASFNATLVLPDPALGWDADGWNDAPLEFRDLAAI